MCTLPNAIAKITDIPENSILVIPITSLERFEATDIRIYNSEQTLKSVYKKHFEDMADVGYGYANLKVCALAKFREKLSEENTAQKVYEYLQTII